MPEPWNVPPPAQAPPQPSPFSDAVPARLGRLRRLLVVVLAVAGLAGVSGGGSALAIELNRPATSAEVAAAAQAEVASRWQRIPAGQIFPSRIPYANSQGMQTAARRVGIAPATSCSAGLDPSIAAVLAKHGCRAVLRATYVDASGALAATVGIAVLPSAAAANQVEVGASWSKAGVRAVAFPGTVSEQFTDSARQAFSVQYGGPYIFFVASGYADGRHGHSKVAGPLGDLNLNLPNPAVAALAATGRPCARKDIAC